MTDQSKLLVWNFSLEEKSRLDELLQEIGAPGAVSIQPSHGYFALREIIHGNAPSGPVLASQEKAVLFHAIPQKGVFFLIDVFRRRGLPEAIYAVVTDHSIDWPFHELLQHLVEERERMEAGSGRKGDGRERT